MKGVKMAFKCKIGLHNWNGCKCTDCYVKRDKQHDWSKDCEFCNICHKNRTNQHFFNSCGCTKCGVIKKGTNYKDHKWNIKTLSCDNCSAKIPDDVLSLEGYSFNQTKFKEVIGISTFGFFDAMKFIYGQQLNSIIDIIKSLDPGSDIMGNFNVYEYYDKIDKFFHNHKLQDIEKICDYIRFVSSFVQYNSYINTDSCAYLFVLLWLGDKKEDVILYYKAVAKWKLYLEVRNSLSEAYELDCFVRKSKLLDENVIEDILNNSMSNVIDLCIIPGNNRPAVNALACFDDLLAQFVQDQYTKEFKFRIMAKFNKLLHAPECTRFGWNNPYVMVENRLNELLKLP